jgi:hypothetical protein
MGLKWPEKNQTDGSEKGLKAPERTMQQRPKRPKNQSIILVLVLGRTIAGLQTKKINQTVLNRK